MAFLALLIGVVLIVAALRNTHGELFNALGYDVPGFAVMGAAIFAVAALGFVPGLKPVSRGLLALIILVIVLTNYDKILSGFEGAWKGAAAQAGGGSDKSSGSGGAGGLLKTVENASGYDFSSLASLDLFGGGTVAT